MYVSKIEPTQYILYSDLNSYIGGWMSDSEENIIIDVWTELTIGFLIKKDMTLKKTCKLCWISHFLKRKQILCKVEKN